MNPTVICSEARWSDASREVIDRGERIFGAHGAEDAAVGKLDIEVAQDETDLLDRLLHKIFDAGTMGCSCASMTAFASMRAGRLAASAAIRHFAYEIAYWTLSSPEMIADDDSHHAGGDEDRFDGRCYAEVYLDIGPGRDSLKPDDLGRDGLKPDDSNPNDSEPDLKMFGIGFAPHTYKLQRYLPERICMVLMRDDSVPFGFAAKSVRPVVYPGYTRIDADCDLRSMLERTYQWKAGLSRAFVGYLGYLCDPGSCPFDVVYRPRRIWTQDDEDGDEIVIDEGPGASDGLRHIVTLKGDRSKSFTLEVTRNGRLEDADWLAASIDNWPERFTSSPRTQVIEAEGGLPFGMRGFDERRPEMLAFAKTFIGWMSQTRSE